MTSALVWEEREEMMDSEKRRWRLKVRSVRGRAVCWEEVAGEGGSGWEAAEEVRVRVERERGMAGMIVELLVS